jgi:predicted DNA-binding transcriptional regulator AlpA
MPVPICRTVQEAYDAGRADALGGAAGTAELAAKVAGLLAPMLPGQRQRLITVAQAAEQLGIGKTRLYELIHAGEIATIELPSPSGAPGRQYVGETGAKASRRIEQAEVDAFIERHRQPRGRGL